MICNKRTEQMSLLVDIVIQCSEEFSIRHNYFFPRTPYKSEKPYSRFINYQRKCGSILKFNIQCTNVLEVSIPAMGVLMEGPYLPKLKFKFQNDLTFPSLRHRIRRRILLFE